jgi:hypothetical protein
MLAAAREEGHAAIPPWTLHDLRRTFVTGMVELHVPPHVVELVVNRYSGWRRRHLQPLRAASRTQGGARTLGDARARPRGAMAGQRVARKRRRK